MFNQNFPGRAGTHGASAALGASDIYSKHTGLLFLYWHPCLPLYTFQNKYPELPTAFPTGQKSLRYGARQFINVAKCPRSTCRHCQLAVMGMIEEMGPVTELRPHRSSHLHPAELLRSSQLKRNLKGSHLPCSALLSLITFSSMTVINTQYLRRVY